MRRMNGSANIVNCDDMRYIQHDDGIGWDIYIRMELLTPLMKALPDDIPEDLVLRCARDLCRALELCESNSILHRDIKPQNIFVSRNGDFKLGDFGIAKVIEGTKTGSVAGTYRYMAPEVSRGEKYGSRADIYSLGLVLYWMLNERRLPFLPLPPAKLQAGEDEQARARRLSGEAIPAPVHGSRELQRIVLKACAYKPDDRYDSASAMLRDIEKLVRKRADAAESAAASDATVWSSPDRQESVRSATARPAGESSVKPAAERTASVHTNRSPASSSSAEQQHHTTDKKRGKAVLILIPVILACIGIAVVLSFQNRITGRNEAVQEASDNPAASASSGNDVPALIFGNSTAKGSSGNETAPDTAETEGSAEAFPAETTDTYSADDDAQPSANLPGTQESWNKPETEAEVEDWLSELADRMTDSLVTAEPEILHPEVGDAVFLGHYEQNGIISDGEEALEWQVLAVENGHALLVTKYVIDAMAFSTSSANAAWKDSSLRYWLNNDFYNSSFSQAERSGIVLADNLITRNAKYNTAGTENTEDHVFLLSLDEMQIYFQTDASRVVKTTKYCQDRLDSMGKYQLWYWLRSPGETGKMAAGVFGSNGKLDYQGAQVDHPYNLVRPAVWIDLSVPGIFG